MPSPPPRPPHQRQRGISLFVVIVFVMLSMLLALWASRTSLFNEMVIGNDADYQRAFEAAQALVQDAELDIRGEKADGSDCRPNCRGGDATKTQIPLEAKEVAALLADLEGITTGPRCSNALCIKRTGRQDFWNNASDTTTAGVDVTLTQMMSTTVGARYGQYTGAEIGSASNPILREQGTTANELKRGGWYWIEVLPYDSDAANSALIAGSTNNLALNLQPNVVYRITAVAHGRKLRREGSEDVPVTQVVLQQTYARQKLKD
ncbi:pilus assembly protein [Acidovorax sp.]|uniref:pilus assembly PilX family protein n=1 Tax=Acidovorax sp. TaxID=1872122 RepID=UPI0025C12F9A|nr:pilus assembly protein [Acidovorax sp.]